MTVLRIRGGPSNQHRQLSDPDTIKDGAIVDVIGVSSDHRFYKVNVGNRSGWVNAQGLRIIGNTDAIPVISVPVTTPMITTPVMTYPLSSPHPLNISCLGARGPSFQIGDRFTVPFGDGSTSIWAEPNGPPRRGRMQEGSGGTIISGPICTGGQNGNLLWWYVRSDAGIEGYSSEGYGNSAVPWIAPVSR